MQLETQNKKCRMIYVEIPSGGSVVEHRWFRRGVGKVVCTGTMFLLGITRSDDLDVVLFHVPWPCTVRF